MLRIQRGLPYFTIWTSWLFPISRFFTHYLDIKQIVPYPRRSDCPGSFRSRQSSGISFERIPLYGQHFTQPPSFQPKLFLDCNPLCLIVKVLASFSFLFIRSSVTSDPLIRSHLIIQSPKTLIDKDSASKMPRHKASTLGSLPSRRSCFA